MTAPSVARKKVSKVARIGGGVIRTKPELKSFFRYDVVPQTGYDEYSLLYSTRDLFSLLVPYSEILLLGRVASNGNESSNVKNWMLTKKTCLVFLHNLNAICFLIW